MGLRIRCAPKHYEALRRDLIGRGAVLKDAEVNRLCAVLRASAPLAALVGYPTHVKDTTQATAQLVMWLSHYEPVDAPPGGSAA